MWKKSFGVIIKVLEKNMVTIRIILFYGKPVEGDFHIRVLDLMNGNQEWDNDFPKSGFYRTCSYQVAFVPYK